MNQKLVVGKYTLESLTNGLYSSPLDVYREYIQNSADSFDISIRNGLNVANNLFIDISIDRIKKSITITDNGIGIKEKEAVSTLLDIGNSHKKRNSFRGFRGIGRLAGLGYCDKLIFQTSFYGESVATVIEFNSSLLSQLLLSDDQNSISIDDVINQIVTIEKKSEKSSCSYFKVFLYDVHEESGLIDEDKVKNYIIQHAPIGFSPNFIWGKSIVEKIKLNGINIPQYNILLNGNQLFKPYADSFISDRVKRQVDCIHDVDVKSFYRNNELSAIIWFAKSNFFGTIIDNSIKGIRIRQGNILIGDKGSCNHLFKEERFNGWMIGELYIIDNELIANSRRDGFEKNKAYFELEEILREWAFDISKEIRHESYTRSLSNTKKRIVEAEKIEDLCDTNDLLSEDLSYAEDYCENFSEWQSESEELAETDYISKLGILLDEKKMQTKYNVLNINSKLTIEQRKILERVFDLISQEFDNNEVNKIVNIIANKF